MNFNSSRCAVWVKYIFPSGQQLLNLETMKEEKSYPVTTWPWVIRVTHLLNKATLTPIYGCLENSPNYCTCPA